MHILSVLLSALATGLSIGAQLASVLTFAVIVAFVWFYGKQKPRPRQVTVNVNVAPKLLGRNLFEEALKRTTAVTIPDKGWAVGRDSIPTINAAEFEVPTAPTFVAAAPAVPVFPSRGIFSRRAEAFAGLKRGQHVVRFDDDVWIFLGSQRTVSLNKILNCPMRGAWDAFKNYSAGDIISVDAIGANTTYYYQKQKSGK